MQAIFLDGHLLLEQTARSRSGRFFNFTEPPVSGGVLVSNKVEAGRQIRYARTSTLAIAPSLLAGNLSILQMLLRQPSAGRYERLQVPAAPLD